jgi:hypothetical protein
MQRHLDENHPHLRLVEMTDEEADMYRRQIAEESLKSLSYR